MHSQQQFDVRCFGLQAREGIFHHSESLHLDHAARIGADEIAPLHRHRRHRKRFQAINIHTGTTDQDNTGRIMNPTELLKGTLARAQVGGFHFVELFMQASPIVKGVMIGLLLASIWSWAIIIEKLFAFRRARIEADKFEQLFWSGQSLDELYANLSRGRTITIGALFVAAMREWKRSVEGNIRALGGIQMRVEKVMDVTISREMELLDRRLLFLATVGSTAPFVGLFGTVWGIYHALVAIGVSGTGTLDKVAGPVGEALIMTGLGLAVAIPAVVGYNWLTRANRVMLSKLDAFAYELHTFVSMGQPLGTEAAPSTSVRPISPRPVAA